MSTAPEMTDSGITNAEPAEPFAKLPATTGGNRIRTCAKCKATTDADRDNCPTCGAILPLNRLRLKGGLRSRGVAREVRIRFGAAMRAKAGEIIRDRGGRQAATALLLDSVEDYVFADALDRRLRDDLQSPTTPKKQVKALFRAWCELLDRKMRLRDRIGLDRASTRAGSFADSILDAPEVGTGALADSGAEDTEGIE